MLKGKLLFICFENSIQSLMAEGFANLIAPEGVEVFSAGIKPSLEVHPEVIKVMKKHDINIANYKPKIISSLYKYQFDLVITLGPKIESICPLLTGSPAVIHWKINAPDSAINMEQCLQKIMQLVEDLFKQGYWAFFIRQKNNYNLTGLQHKYSDFHGIISTDPQMLHIFQQIQNVAGYDASVHIYGATGTGKELIAHAIHNESQRKNGPFVPINCGALPEGLIESELFGHVKGAFSGAIRDKKGRFELAHNGTIFLDEVSELPKHAQVKLLRFLQEGLIEKVGSEKIQTVNVRIISATNKVLKTEIRSHRFRDDLFYRLNVIPLNLPPLQARRQDIPLLVGYFLNKFEHIDYYFSKQSLEILMQYDWPGNVRELENIVQFAVIASQHNVITPADLPMELNTSNFNQKQKGRKVILIADAVKSALKKTGGNKAKAARLLGVSRATIYRFITDYPEVLSV